MTPKQMPGTSGTGIWQFFCRSAIIYLCVNMVLLGPTLYVFAKSPIYHGESGGGIFRMPNFLFLYLYVWLGPFAMILGQPASRYYGIGFLVIAAALAVFGIKARNARTSTKLLALSAFVWFGASFLQFLSDSI